MDDPCAPKCPLRYVADGFYTAQCPAGTTGAQVTKHVQAESQFSVEHARKLANEEAKRQAEAALVCVGQTYIATRTGYAITDCPFGMIGGPFNTEAEATRTSTVSQDDAEQLALAAAEELARQEGQALAGEFCMLPPPEFSASAEYPLSCPMGSEGDPVIGYGQADSNISQEDADINAQQAAMQDAYSKIVCSVVTEWTRTRSYTANCGEGTFGPSVTAEATYTSYVSAEDADSQAYAQAQANAEALLVCDPYVTAEATVTVQCSSDNSYQTATASAQGETYDQAYDAAYQTAQSQAFAQCPVDPPPEDGGE